MPRSVQLFTRIVGAEHVLTGERLSGRNPGYCGTSLDAGLLLRPGSSRELAAICRAAHDHGVPLVPHGGLTGLVDGTASQTGEAIVSFERMNRILRIDAAQAIAVVEPGVTLAALDAALAPHGLICGVDIAARGSCTLGGMVATNAGGTRVLKYGMMRQNVLGLEVALADGRLLDMTSPLVKNNAGYDLKQLFIGSEGTLGLVSKIVLKLWPAHRGIACALIACDGAGQMAELLAEARRTLGEQLLSFEAMWPAYYRLTTAQPGFGIPPLGPDHGLYLIIEALGEGDAAAEAALLVLLEPAYEKGLVADAIVAQSAADRARIWRAREDSDAIEHGFAANLSYDIGLQLRDLGPFAARLSERLGASFPKVPPFIFGHVDDGNLHVMLGIGAAEFGNRRVFDDLVYQTVSKFAGSTVSAEHGIGLEKRDYLGLSAAPEVVALMKTLKTTLDPRNILNRGKIIAM